MGIAMSITAFPVLARIILEGDLTRSHPGTVSLGCAAVDDISAWCILCVLVSIVKADGMAQPFIVVAIVLVYIAVMIFLLRPSLRRLLPSNPFSEGPLATSNYNSWAAVLLAFALSSGLATEIIGVHALFGAFLAGTIIPAGHLRTYCKERFEVVASGLLLPLFFAFTGLRTQITLLDSARAWLICAAVLIVAVAGKLGGSMLAARWSGIDWNDSFVVGILMNTRGLMELIALNIGFDLGIISAQMFAMLVLMALISTIMTAPLLACTNRDTIRN